VIRRLFPRNQRSPDQGRTGKDDRLRRALDHKRPPSSEHGRREDQPARS
jgi:hypothetical protein